MVDKIKNVRDSVGVLLEYKYMIEDICENKSLFGVSDPVYDATLEDVEKYKNFYDRVSLTCNSEVFAKMKEFIFRIKKTCCMLTCMSGDGGATYFQYGTEDRKIKGVESIDIAPLNRRSMDFVYAHEGVHGVYYESRIAEEYIDHENIEVLPYFIMLYTYNILGNEYPIETQNSVISRFITNVYAPLGRILDSVNSYVCVLNEEEAINYMQRLTGCSYDCAKSSVIYEREGLFQDYQQLIGPIKALALYEACKNGVLNFDEVVNGIIDSSKPMGEELDYNQFDVNNDDIKNMYKSFVLNNVNTLRDMIEVSSESIEKILV